MSKIKLTIEVEEGQEYEDLKRGICNADTLRNAKPIEECDDCVSRRAVNKISNKVWNYLSGAYNPYDPEQTEIVKNVDKYIKMLDRLPSAAPQPKTGHWVRVSIDKYSEYAKYWYRCDRCGKDNLGDTNYCPNCGAEMVIKSCSTCKHDGELVCATHGCHNKERYEVKA